MRIKCNSCGHVFDPDPNRCPACLTHDTDYVRAPDPLTEKLATCLREMVKWCSGENEVGDGEDAEDALVIMQGFMDAELAAYDERKKR